MSDSVGGAATDQFDAVVIGAGFAGLGMLYWLRRLGLRTRIYDAAGDVGGTWYWNRYPGARTDSECYYYCFSKPETLLYEWKWTERYPGWREALSYLEFIAERLDLRRDIKFNTRVESAVYDAARDVWVIHTDKGDTVSAKYFISGTGFISQPYTPDFPGLDSYQGECYHTARWPHHEVDFTNKRVGVIGAGASAIQVVPVVAEEAEQVTLFQRTPNYVLPARNKPMTKEWWNQILRDYPAIWQKTREHVFAMPFFWSPTRRNAVDTPAAERQAIFQELWEKEGSFRFVFESFDDLLTNPEANEMAAEFLRSKIREIVEDQDTAERLVPKTYPLFGKRPPLEHGYYEAFNRDNVQLVDTANEEPIKEITPNGVRTKRGEHKFDILVMATGFDAITGALDRIDIKGKEGYTLRDKWKEGPKTFLGLCTNGFPNFFIINGPQSPFANLPTVIEENIWWITDCIEHMEKQRLSRGEATVQSEEEWTRLTNEVLEHTVMRHGTEVNSWFLGTNIPGKPQSVLTYFGGADDYFNRCRECATNHFEGMRFSGETQPEDQREAPSRAVGN